MAQFVQSVYRAADFTHLKGLQGISDRALEIHLGLYQGYVTNTNRLHDELQALLREGKGSTPQFAELTRRLGFEYSGMVLHEYYFENLTSNGTGVPAEGSEVQCRLTESFGSWDAWVEHFQTVGKMRGVGWAVLFQDPVSGRLSNHWITLHEDGHPAGFKPVLVMDVWEHAFLFDYTPAERAKYIDAFFANIDWRVVEARLTSSGAVRAIGR